MGMRDDVCEKTTMFLIDSWQNPYMARFRPYYNRYKEMLLYAFFGGGTVLINVIVYSVLTETFFWGILVANAVAWLFATLFAFFTNRTWVFASHARGVKAFCLQLGASVSGVLSR